MNEKILVVDDDPIFANCFAFIWRKKILIP